MYGDKLSFVKIAKIWGIVRGLQKIPIFSWIV